MAEAELKVDNGVYKTLAGPMVELVEITAQVISFLERLTADQPVYNRELSGLKERITQLRFPD